MPAPPRPQPAEQLLYESTVSPTDHRAGMREQPRTLRSVRQAAVRSVLITIFSLSVMVYAIGLYFEVFKAPSVSLSSSSEVAPLPEGPEPFLDPTGQIIHEELRIAPKDAAFTLEVRTRDDTGWSLSCVHRAQGESDWRRAPMESSEEGAHKVTLTADALASGVMEYYFEAANEASGEQTLDGSPDAPYWLHAR